MSYSAPSHDHFSLLFQLALDLFQRPSPSGQVEQLSVWSYGLPLPGQSETAVTPAALSPVLSDGYLCTPQPDFLAQVVEQLVASRSIAFSQSETLGSAA